MAKLKIKKVGLIEEFKQFITRGNVIDLAVGVIIGAAFQSIVNSLVNDVIMPFVGLFTGGTNFSDKFIVLKYANGVRQTFHTVDQAKEAGATVLAYGSFITAVLNFLILAAVIFLLVKGINKIHDLGKKPVEIAEPEPAPTTKVCPFCKSEIDIGATRCPHCTSVLE